MSYYTLISRDSDDMPWGVEFGDFEREIVEDEQRDMNESAENQDFEIQTRIIRTATADQADIDAQLANLNRHLNEGSHIARSRSVPGNCLDRD